MKIETVRQTVQQAMRRVQANMVLLDACEPPHEFLPIEPFTKAIPRFYKCTKCGGRIEILEKRWYERGLEHGRKLGQEPNDERG